MEKEQLVSMGFPDDLASQALAATGGKSILEATEWIFSRGKKSDSQAPEENPNSSPSPSPSPSGPSPFQPKLDRFFHFQSKPSNPSQIQKEHCDTSDTPNPPPSKRLRLEAENSPHDHKQQQSLSERMRPRTLDDVVGQDHLLSHKSLLRSAIDSNRLPSVVLWGPPGTGKTSIARAIVNSSPDPSSYRFVSLSAVTAGVKDVRDVVEEARKLMKVSKGCKRTRTVLFVDEVHRFNKSQQDSFLPVIEDGSIVFIGATTENPSFHLITPLLSRCRVLTLSPLQPSHVASLLNRAIADRARGLAWSVGGGGASIEVRDDAIDFLSSHCDGDARVALNALEISAVTAAAARAPRIIKQSGEEEELVENNGVGVDVDVNVASSCSSQRKRWTSVTVSLDDAKEALQSKHLAYDKAGEEHYNLISALHKSMRGSDADASIYWLARMLEGGEEPLYIARRLIRFASEDVGLADPNALLQAVASYQACHFLGMPECNVNLAQCVAYLALAPKSVSVYRAILAAQQVVKESVGQNEGVPLHLRNAPTKLMKELGYGKGYVYPPDNPSSSPSPQTYLPPSLQGYKFLN